METNFVHHFTSLGDLNGTVGRTFDNKIIGRHDENVIDDNGTRWIEVYDINIKWILLK